MSFQQKGDIVAVKLLGYGKNLVRRRNDPDIKLIVVVDIAHP